MSYGKGIVVDMAFDQALQRVRTALIDNGFGVVSEIDMEQTLRNKLGVEIGPLVILGACSPGHAHRALQADPSIALLLPCNVVVRGADGGTLVEVIDTDMMVRLSESEGIGSVADEIGAKLAAVLSSLAAVD